MTSVGVDNMLASRLKSLEGRRFVATRIEPHVDMGIVPIATRPYVELGDNNRISGFAGCNRYAGSYRIDDKEDKIVIGPLTSTRMYCEGMMEVENKFLSALQSARKVLVSNGRFSLLGEDGVILIELEEERR